ncbi:MAG: hypothetical protein Q7S20_13990 [Gemmatimonadaceae bacterium]|nr:hypothetical protein [Gemmatimonadaceae bacterium]
MRATSGTAGACRNCGGLLLQGNLHVEPGSVAPNYGIYDVSWISLQDGPTMKEASFKLRDTDNKVIAQVTYTVKSNVNKILYNGLDTGIPWVQHKPNSIRIRVDLNSPRNTTLWIDGTTPVMSNVPFKESVSNFSNVAADFLGIDSGN